MTETPNFTLPYLAANQAQKHVTFNESLRRLDALIQLTVKSASVLSPPSTPTDDDQYIIPAGATEAWIGAEPSIAAWQDGAWEFYTAGEGWHAWVVDENQSMS